MIDQSENLTFCGCLGSTLRKKVFGKIETVIAIHLCVKCPLMQCFERKFVVIVMKGKIG
jgi:hypothetical protein